MKEYTLTGIHCWDTEIRKTAIVDLDSAIHVLNNPLKGIDASWILTGVENHISEWRLVKVLRYI